MAEIIFLSDEHSQRQFDLDINTEIGLPTEIQKFWSGFKNWKIEVSFSLQGRRCVFGALYEEYSSVKVLDDILSKLLNDTDGSLPIYRFYCKKIIPMFRVYANGKLFSSGSPRAFYDRGPVQGARPWEYKSDDTVFSLGRYQKNKHFGEPYIRLHCGGRSKPDAVSNWKNLRKQIVDYTKK